VQLPGLLYRLAAECDGRHDVAELAATLSDEFQLHISPENVLYLVEQKLQPLGVIARPDGEQYPLRRADPLLAFTFRAAVIPPRVVNGLAWLLRPLFFPIVTGAVLAWLVTLDVWLFFHHGVAQSVRQVLFHPVLLLLLLGLVTLSGIFHEFGHAAACRYGGARPGAIGAGIYLVWPALYTDVTDAYRLGRGGRLRTDLGGVYFNAIFILGTAGAYFLTGSEWLLALIVLQHAEILHQFIPWVRLDGYYVISDLTGVPDVLSRVKPVLRSLIPWREPEESVAQLKPWVRVAVTAYVVTVVPILLGFFALMVYAAPRIFATAWSSGHMQVHHIATAATAHAYRDLVFAAVQLFVLSLPALALALTFARICRRVVWKVVRPVAERPRLRFAVALAAVASAVLTALAWSSGVTFAPISRDDSGTLGGAVHGIGGRFHHPPPRREPLPKRHKRAPVLTHSTTTTAATTTSPQTSSTETTTPADTVERPATTGDFAPVSTEPNPTTTEEVVTTTDTTTVEETTTTTSTGP
jgi:putative peptide zinc metalloprotease protein